MNKKNHLCVTERLQDFLAREAGAVYLSVEKNSGFRATQISLLPFTGLLTGSVFLRH